MGISKMIRAFIVLGLAAYALAECGTAELDLTDIHEGLGFDKPTMLFPRGSPCTIPDMPGETDCEGGESGWDIFMSFCAANQAVSNDGNDVTACGGSSVCQSWSPMGSANCGKFSTAQYSYAATGGDEGKGALTFKVGGGDPVTGNPRPSTVILQCSSTNDPTPVLTAEEGVPVKYMYTWKWSHTCFCPGGCTGGGGLGFSGVFLIIFFVLIVVYLAAGVAFQAGVKKERGLDMLPQREVWKNVFGLIKDGISFT